jgi:tetratricopeptide (TPR) repeat protein
VALCREVLRAAPSARRRYNLAAALENLAASQRDAGQLAAAAASLGEVVAGQHPLLSDRGEDAATLRHFVRALMALGDALDDGDDRAAAARAYRDALPLCRRVVALADEAPSWVVLAGVLDRLGAVERMAGHRRDASTLAEEAVALCRRADAVVATPGSACNLAASLINLAAVRRDCDDARGAWTALASGAASVQHAHDADPASASIAWTYAILHRDLGDAAAAAGVPADARTAYEKAQAACASLLDDPVWGPRAAAMRRAVLARLARSTETPGR